MKLNKHWKDEIFHLRLEGLDSLNTLNSINNPNLIKNIEIVECKKLKTIDWLNLFINYKN